MNILVLGCSDVFIRRVLPALNSSDEINKINVASKSKRYNLLNCNLYNKLEIFFDDYSLAINSFCSDIVYISLPNHLHYIWVKKSLELGLNVVVEKPATLNFSETKYLVNLANKKNLCIAESTVWAYHQNINFVKKQIFEFQNKPINLKATFTIPSIKPNNYRNFTKFGGGAFNDLSAYAVSISREIFNDTPINISGEILSFDDSTGIDKAFKVDMKFNNGNSLEGIFGFGFDYKNTLEINGQNFVMNLDRVFSPPRDIEVNIKTTIDDISNDYFFVDDCYANFFKLIKKSFKTNDKHKWSQIMLEDAILTNKLKSVLEIH